MKRKRLKVLSAAAFILAGVGLMVYPFAANYVFEHRQESIISAYDEEVACAGEEAAAVMLAEAKSYNESLLRGNVQLHDPFTEQTDNYDESDYFAILNMDGTGVMGYVSIPCINVFLPIYHGTSGSVLEKGIGHLEGTSLPVGGEGTHAVLTGHTGLSSAKLFTDLTLLEEGDVFFLSVPGEKLAYEVDRICVVEPGDTSELGITKGEDYCTLLTCTPYGINSHRLLVRGKRTEYTETMEKAAFEVSKTKNSEWMRQYRYSLCMALALIAAAFIVLFFFRMRNGRRILRIVSGVVIISAGIGIYLYPNIREWELEMRTNRLIASLEALHAADTGEEGANPDEEMTGDKDTVEGALQYVSTGEETQEDAGSGWDMRLYPELYKKMQEYNQNLVINGQQLVDAWSYAQEPVDLSGIPTDDGAVGYIRIPAMDVTLPLYIGATTENMSKGAAVLSETSMPTGGEDTNCVIAGHRGYSGMPYFREIEKLQTGDFVYVTNLWDTMTYVVEEIRIVDPDDVESILIVPGRDLITLLTCHPYMSHGKYRYIVVCARTDTPDTDGIASGGTDTSGTGQTDVSSAGKIAGLFGRESLSELLIIVERAMRLLIPAMMLDLAVTGCLRKKRRH